MKPPPPAGSDVGATDRFAGSPQRTAAPQRPPTPARDRRDRSPRLDHQLAVEIEKRRATIDELREAVDRSTAPARRGYRALPAWAAAEGSR